MMSLSRQAARASTLVELLRRQALEQPDRPGYIFLRDGEVEAERLTYGELDRKAQTIAARLQACSSPGDRALLLYPPGLEFVAAFFGCLYAGVVAVPAYPPKSQREDPRVRAILVDAAPCAVLTTSALLAEADAAGVERPPILHLPTDALPEDLATGWRQPALSGEDLAFLQYTSGSTAMPKGVEVTHANLLHNEEMIRRAFGQCEESIVVGWLPLYHDMGLIGCVLQPLYVGGRCVLMSPMAFLQRPARWLEAISRYRATTSGGPNFAYDLCVRKVPAERRDALDLSSWQVAFSGAEPVRAETLERFAAWFAPCGFRRQAFYPCYGLAEATLFVTGGATEEAPVIAPWSAPALEEGRAEHAVQGRRLVGCGHAWAGQELVIIDPESGNECPPGRIGEIWLSGPSVARGYWNRPEETQRNFCARIQGRETEGPFLRTGDLGFLRDGELFVTGRLKDLIIIRGRNHYPHDVEATVEASHPALRSGCSAAFAVEIEGEERLIVVAELERRRETPADASEAAEAIRRAVSEGHELQVQEIVLIRTGTIPKTSSGKIRRRECRSLYLAGKLDAVGRSPLESAAEGAAGGVRRGLEALLALPAEQRRPVIEWRLRQLAAEALRVAPSRLGPEQVLTSLGLDSLAAMELQAVLEAELGVAPAMAALLGGASLGELVSEVMSRLETPAPPRPTLATDVAKEFPLSAGQRGLWLTERLAATSAVYNIAVAARLVGDVDIGALQRALLALIRRHPALRTTFHEMEEGPVQRVAEEVGFDLAYRDVSGWSPARLREHLRELPQRPFDLSAGPLLRVEVLALGAGEHAVGLVVHHLVSDFWSLAVLARELGVLYARETVRGGAELGPVPVSYASYVSRQERLLRGAEGEELWEYWRDRLSGLPASSELPTDRPRPPMQTYAGAVEASRLGGGLSARLRALAQRHGASLFSVLLAGFQTLVHRYSGQEDLAIGSPSANRTSSELSLVVGYFVNPLVLRVNLSDSPPFTAILGQVQRSVVGALEHQGYPFPLLAERLEPTRDPSRSPLFQLLFVLQRAPGGDEALTAFALGQAGGRLVLGGLVLESLAFDPPGAQFDLSLRMGEVGGELVASLQYNRDLFDASTIRRLLEQLGRLLASAAEQPESPIGALSLLSPAERHQLLWAWNDTKTEGSRGLCLHELVAAQAVQTPESPALVAGPEVLSYRELTQRAQRLAQRLRGLGVGPEERVGVLLGRCPEMVVSLLAVLEAGGAYVAMDPEYPAERLGLLVEDAGMRWVLTEERWLDRLPAGARVQPLRIDRPWPAPSERPRVQSYRCADEDNLAYLIYTSGSTGRPKGVAVTHRNVVALVEWSREVWSDAELSGVLASTSIAFDLSVFELFVPLSRGGTVMLAASALELPRLAAVERVTLINTVPSIMSELLQGSQLPAGVQTVNLAGEALPGPLVERLYEYPGVERVLNLYGPSEDTTYSTWAEVPRGPAGRPPIGQPILGTHAYVLDVRGEPVPLGAGGELYLGGEGLARGYLGRPELTAERFVPDPFGSAPGARLYRTGDRVRYRSTGDLEFQGRIDHQVKLRGVRIEPGEIEAALGAHQAVREAVVVVRKGADGGPRLVAYVVAGPEVAPADLGEFLRGRLPGPLVPSAFVRLESLPRTPNGKLDRGSLPEPPAAGPEAAAADPRDPIEELVAGIWCTVLGRERVGIHDNFFELGGHSLLGTRVLAHLRRLCGVELSLRSLFESPTVAGMAARVAAARRAGKAGETLPIEPLPRDGSPLRLSFSQERLWFLSQVTADGAAYNLCGALRMTGDLDGAVLAASLREIVRRQESLRTTFSAHDGQPAQVVSPPGAWDLLRVDLDGLPGSLAWSTARTLVDGEAERPFDLVRGPLFRASLLRLDASEHVLVLNLHHIISDGWSLAVLTREIEALYTARASGRLPTLPEPAVQYADYALWQRRRLTGDTLAELLGYWRQRFADGPQVLELPTDRPRPPFQTFRGAQRVRRLPTARVAAIERRSLAEGVTPFMTSLAAFLVLLQRHTGQTNLTVGTFIANRNRAETEGLIGFFVNNLALRVALSEGSFRELLAQVRDTTLGAYVHQDLSFERLLAELKLERSVERTPLFQVMFVLQNTPRRTLALPGIEVEPLPVPRSRSNFDLTLWLEPEGGGLTALAEYNRDLFDAATLDRLLGHFDALLGGAVDTPHERLDALPLLSEPERHQLTAEWSDTGAGDPRVPVHVLVRRKAAAVPDAVAVTTSGESLTYGALACRACDVAWRLREAGVGPGSLVGLCAERSPDMVVGILGILEAGGAYLPLDPTLPRERLGSLLSDAPVAMVVTQGRLMRRFDGHRVQILCLDGGGSAVAGGGWPSVLPPIEVSQDDLAYLIYTSGSTGQPKAVMVRHGSLASYTVSAVRHYRLGPVDRVLQFASVSFDASAEEIFPTLVCGATLVLRDDAMLASPAGFLDTCRAWGVTVLDLPTSYWHELAADPQESRLPDAVRLVIIGGEKALPERLAQWGRQSARGARLVNTYGPTEGTVVATRVDLMAGTGLLWRVPIGRPVDGVSVHMLDRSLQPVPIGVAGELCIGGVGVARGYLARPKLTAEHFVPDPFAPAPGARLYRTGDVARHLPDGTLEYLERADRQVKVRGYRVELGEIEALLTDHARIREAAVVIREEAPGRRRLEAYLAGEQPDVSDVRAYLRGRLPEYMVPAAFGVLEQLPRTPAGKIDRASLPVLERPAAGGELELVVPRTPTEELLAGIWAEVLGAERIGVQDDFFELGGYSLLATQVIARVREACGVELPLAVVFEASTLEQLADRVDQAGRTVLPPIEPVPRDGDLPVSFSQERVWFLTQLDRSLTAYHVPRALRLTGPMDLGLLERAYGALLERHEILRTSFPTVGGRPVQRIHPPSPFRMGLVDLTALPADRREAEVPRRILDLGQQLFDLEHGPMLRATTLRLAERDHVIVQTEHHLVHDGWAEGILVRDLLGFYNAFVAGIPPALPPLPIQFADFASWQRRWLQGEVLESQIAYWRRRLAGAPALLDLPTDRPRPAVQGSRGGERELHLTAELLGRVQELARRNRVTLFMATLAAFELVLSRASGQTDLVLGTGIANRRRAETEGLLGMIINNVPLRTVLVDDLSCRGLLAQVREICMEAYAHQDVPFEKLVEALQPPRSLSYTPIFQVMFAFHDGPPRHLEIPGVTITPLESHNRSSKFDMLVIAVPERRRGAEAGVTDLAFYCEYDSELFDGTTVSRLLRHFENALWAMVRDESREIADLPLLGPAETHQVLHEWGTTAGAPEVAGPKPVCLHELFEAQAARTPAAPALVFGRETLSYGDLDGRASSLAGGLRALGVGPESRVGICLERSPDLVIAILAVLKAGGAYVPLDPAYPRERQAFTLEDSRAVLLLTREGLLANLPNSGLPVACIDRIESDGPAGPPVVHPGNLAYVIYTSGSTGRPKGVAIEHRSAVALVRWAHEVFAPEELAGVLASTSVCFDLSVFELFVPLSRGGKVILAENVLHLAVLPAAGEVTLINTVPSGLTELLRLGDLRVSEVTVNLAGEALPGSLVRQLHSRPDVRRVLNLYGPSEDTTYSTYAVIAQGEPAPPIGRPVAGTRAYVLDRFLRPAPIGVPGELFLGGEGLARGYLDRPDLTAERFVPDPFSGEPGHRLYHTGDFVRTRRTGDLEFLGRADHQVKVRGFRIELGEIEALLDAHPGVGEGAVVVRGAADDLRIVAYVVPAGPAAASAAEELAPALRRFLRERLPVHMVPSSIVELDELPRTANGKVDRKALPDPVAASGGRGGHRLPESALEREIAAVWQRLLGVQRVGLHDNFFDLGAHSLLMVRAFQELRDLLGDRVGLIDLFRYPSISALVESLEPRASSEPRTGPGRVRPEAAAEVRWAAAHRESIAIIGMKGRFPRASDVDQFWRNLCDGVEAITFFSDQELLARGIAPELLREPSYVKADAVLEGADLFDAGFFGYSPREARIMDPQHRLFLECAWEALEDAGYAPGRTGGAVGVFAGVSANRYLLSLYSHPGLLEGESGYLALVGNDKDFLPTRVSYKLDLKGPSLSVQTACSTSLAAVHLACQSLLRGECDMALAGGVSVNALQGRGYTYTEGGIASLDGHCRAFDANARGTVSGNGLGVVVLKRLSEALADGDAIRAVVRGSALNNDGSDKVGYTAPSVSGQARVIAEAQAVAGVHPEWIDYVEAHGTGTEVGDPIEIAALTEAFRGRTGETGYCAIGSVKTNVGHLDAAAGITGLIKTVLALQHKQIPPSLNYERPNPRIDFDRSPFVVNARLAPWPAREGRRRLAGVSSFGLGGTNVHLIVEEAPELALSSASRPLQLLVLSAKTPTALETATDDLSRHLGEHPGLSLADVAFTLQVGRARFGHRRALVCRDAAEARAALAARDPERVLSLVRAADPGRIVFMFPGSGTQYADMGLELYRTEPVFRQAIDECLDLFALHMRLDPRPLLYPGEYATDGAPSSALRRAESAMPALFATEYALAKLWMSWGVEPRAMIGHSLGECVAACLAGVLSLKDAVALVALRGRLFEDLPEGAMLSVPLPEAEVVAYLGSELSLAAVNGPSLSVLSGPVEAIDEVRRALVGQSIEARRLRIDAATHSALVDRILPEFAALVGSFDLQPPRIPFVSNLTGTWIRDAEATDPGYWVRHLRHTVRFGEGLATLLAEPQGVLLEVGPGRTLSTLVRRHPARSAGHEVFPLMRHSAEPISDLEHTFDALARLWLLGVEIDSAGFYAHERRRRISLPSYPFERRRFWIEPVRSAATARPHAGKKADLAGWFYTPSWRPSPPPPPPPEQPAGTDGASHWLVLADELGLGTCLAESLRRRGHDVITAVTGPDFARLGDAAWVLDPRQPEGYVALLQELAASGGFPHRVVHLWSMRPEVQGETSPEFVEREQACGFLSLIFLGRALEESRVIEPVQIDVVSAGIQEVDGVAPRDPERATVLAACTVLPQEYLNVTCRSIDLSLPSSGDVERLTAELLSGSSDRAVAYRSGRRFVRGFDPLPLERSGRAPVLRERGVYWITGGLGRVGLSLARYLAVEARARLLLTGRSPLPSREGWREWVRAYGEEDRTSQKIRRLEELEALGAEVLTAAADVADEVQMRAAVETAAQRFGDLHGVIHAAGIVGEGVHRAVRETGWAELARHFRPKVLGTLTLARVLQGRDLDFCLLMSSLSSVLGGLGLGTYAAANLFLNAFACRMNRGGGFPWLSLISDAWELERERGAGSEVGLRLADLAMTSREGAEAFGRALWMIGTPQVVISTSDLEIRMGEWVHTEPEASEEAEGSLPDGSHPRRDLPTPYVEPRDETELGIAQLWQQLLGVDRVGIHDSFFALGGDSLLATRLVSGLRRKFKTDVPLRVLFEKPTVAGQAATIAARSTDGGNGSSGPVPIARRSRNILEQLQDLDSLTEEDMRGLLDHEGH